MDLRDRTAYAGRHLAGTVLIGIGRQFSTYAGWVIPWGAPVTVIGEDAEQVAEAQRQLVRIGIDHLAGSATGELDSLAPAVPTRSYQQATFAEVRAPGQRGSCAMNVGVRMCRSVMLAVKPGACASTCAIIASANASCWSSHPPSTPYGAQRQAR